MPLRTGSESKLNAPHKPKYASAVPSELTKSGEGFLRMDPQDVSSLFEFFANEQTGVIGADDFLDVDGPLGQLLQHQPLSEKDLLSFMPVKSRKKLLESSYDFLPKKTFLTESDLQQIIAGNELKGFDPFEEAFKYLDDGTGHVDERILVTMLQDLGFGEISAKDMQYLISISDVDGDGAIGFHDFVSMVHYFENPAELEELREKQRREEMRAESRLSSYGGLHKSPSRSSIR